MKRLDAYQQHGPNWTRIEMLLAAFDGVMTRLKTAQEHLDNNDQWKAQPFLLRSQRLVLELYSGLDLRHGQIPDNMRNLYLFVLNCIGMGETLNIPAAIDVLAIIRDGLEKVRPIANSLEHRGEVPHAPIHTSNMQGVAG